MIRSPKLGFRQYSAHISPLSEPKEGGRDDASIDTIRRGFERLLSGGGY